MHRELQTPHFRFSYSESPADHPVLWENHCHDRYEMIAILEGDINVTLEGRSYRLREHQVIMIPPLTYHVVSANTDGVYKRVTALFDLSAVPPPIQSEFLQRDATIPLFTSPSLEDLRDCCRADDGDAYAPLAESLMVSLLYNRLKPSAVPDEPTGVNDAVLRLIAYVDEHFCEKLLLDDLARQVNLSKFFLCHLFEEEMGIPPKQYILQKRMAYAAKLIREGHPPTRVALQVGYASYSTFYRIYLKYFGESPAQARSRCP